MSKMLCITAKHAPEFISPPPPLSAVRLLVAGPRNDEPAAGQEGSCEEEVGGRDRISQHEAISFVSDACT